MEEIQVWIINNWIVPVAAAGLTALGGVVLKVIAKWLPWVKDDSIVTLIKGRGKM